jgi:hypothetical protein
MAAQDFRVKNGLIVGTDITFDAAAEGGVLSWNDSDRTLDLTQDGVTLQIGQEMHFMVRNASGSTIPNGTFLGFVGVTVGSNRIIAAPFDASTMGAHQMIGFATESISNGVNGFATTFGYVRGLDTRGTAVTAMAVGDEDWSVGDILYPHPTVPGKLTNVEPTTGFKSKVAAITNRHQNLGEIFVRVTVLDENAYLTGLSDESVGDLSDVNITSATDGQLLTWDATNGEWINADPPATYGDSDVGTYLSANGYDTASNIKSDIIDSAPATLDTLNELAAALGDDANFATTVTTSIGTKWTQDNTKITNWDTAYGWGDHSTAGYLTTLGSVGGHSDVDITTSAPTSGQALVWDGSNFVPGDVTASFLGLTDTASSFGTAGQAVIVNAGANGLEFGDVTADFIGLTDSPASYSSQGDRVVKVKSDETGIEFGDLVAGSNVRETYTGDGTTTDFTTTATFHGQNDLLVFVDGVIQYPGSDFTLSAKTLTFLTAPGSGAEILLYGLTPITSVVTPGDGTVTAAKLAASAYTRDTFSGDNSTTSFTLTRDPGTVYSPFIYVDGVIQDPITHYTISGTTLTFTFTPATGTDNILVVYGPTNVAGTVSDGAITFAKLAPGNFQSQIETGDGTTTDFALDQQASSEDHLIVTVAGVPQAPDGVPYTVINNGNTISFSAAPSNGAKIVIRWYATTTYVVPPDDSITTAMIQDGSITSDKIATGGVATVDMADGSVTSLKIANGGIATEDLADDAVTPAKLDREYATKGTSIALSIALG